MIRLVLCVLLLLAAPAHADDEALRRDLGEAWTFLESGLLRKAGEAFDALRASEAGARSAEVYYGGSVVAWERRNAAEALALLSAARDLAAAGEDWDGGKDGIWDLRVQERLRFLEARFSARTLRLPDRGDPLPPLADPPPEDPLLKQFADAVSGQVSEAAGRGASSLDVVLPEGSWWVGKLEWHGGTGLDASNVAPWTLAAASGRDLSDYEDRISEIARGGSLARKLIQKLMIARQAPPQMVEAELRRQKAEALAAEYERRRPELEAARARQRALVAAGKHDAAAQVNVNATGGQGAILIWDEVAPDAVGDVNRKLTETFRAVSWHARFAFMAPSKDSKVGLEFPELQWAMRIERNELRVQGIEKVKEPLRDAWSLGGKPNRVDVWFDGKRVRIEVNGRSVGPVEVCEPAGEKTYWSLSIEDPTALMFDLRVQAWTP